MNPLTDAADDSSSVTADETAALHGSAPTSAGAPNPLATPEGPLPEPPSPDAMQQEFMAPWRATAAVVLAILFNVGCLGWIIQSFTMQYLEHHSQLSFLSDPLSSESVKTIVVTPVPVFFGEKYPLFATALRLENSQGVVFWKSMLLAVAVGVLTFSEFFVFRVRGDATRRSAYRKERPDAGQASEPEMTFSHQLLCWSGAVWTFGFLPAILFFVAMILDGEQDAAVFAMALAAIVVAAEHYSSLERQTEIAAEQRKNLTSQRQDLKSQRNDLSSQRHELASQRNFLGDQLKVLKSLNEELKYGVKSIVSGLGKSPAQEEMYRLYSLQRPGKKKIDKQSGVASSSATRAVEPNAAADSVSGYAAVRVASVEESNRHDLDAKAKEEPDISQEVREKMDAPAILQDASVKKEEPAVLKKTEVTAEEPEASEETSETKEGSTTSQEADEHDDEPDLAAGDRQIFAIFRECFVDGEWWKLNGEWDDFMRAGPDKGHMNLAYALMKGQRREVTIVVPYGFRGKIGDEISYGNFIGLLWHCVLFAKLSERMRADGTQSKAALFGSVAVEDSGAPKLRIMMADTALWLHVFDREVHQIVDQPAEQILVRNLSLNLGKRAEPLARWAEREIRQLASYGPTAEEFLCGVLCRADQNIFNDNLLDNGVARAILDRVKSQHSLHLAEGQTLRENRCPKLLMEFAEVLYVRQHHGKKPRRETGVTTSVFTCELE